MKRRTFHGFCFFPRGFSLIEVSIALGIVAFAMMSVVALLPTGLKSVKNANEQAAAANVLTALSDSLRKATTTNSTDYFFTFGNQTITYTLAQRPPDATLWTNLNLEGNVAASDEPARLCARLEIFETPANGKPGQAVVSVAWSALSSPGWDEENHRWTNAEGFLTTGIQFLPRK